MERSQFSPDSNPSYSRDVQKLQDLYKETKDISKRLHTEKNVRFEEEKRQMLRLAENEVQELRETIRFLEMEMKKTKEHNNTLIKKYEDAQDEIQHCHEQIARQANITHSQQSEIVHMQSKIARVNTDEQGILEKSRFKIENYQNEIEARESEIDQLREALNNKNDAIKVVTLAQEQFKHKTIGMEEELQIVKDERIRQQGIIDQYESQIDNMLLNRKSEGTALLEVEQLRADNRRLLSLLKETREFKDFADYIEDSGGANLIKTYSDEPSTRRIKTKAQGGKETETEEWVPEEAFHFAHNFRLKHGTELSETLINQMLGRLNRIWREREKKQIARIKSRYSAELGGLRRQLSMRTPFDQLEAQKMISRLKSDLKSAQKEVKLNIVTKEKNKVAPPGVEMVDKTLKMATAMQKQRKVLEEENSQLKKKLTTMENLTQSEEFERSKFMEGAAWIAQKMTTECDKYGRRVDELINEYNIRTRQKDLTGEIDAIFVSRTQAWLLETIDRSLAEIRDKYKNMAQSATYHHNMANKTVLYNMGPEHKDSSGSQQLDRFKNEIDNTLTLGRANIGI